MTQMTKVVSQSNRRKCAPQQRMVIAWQLLK
jgi:hypothetical protein